MQSQLALAKDSFFSASRGFLKCLICGYLSRDTSLVQVGSPCKHCGDTTKSRFVHPESNCSLQLQSIRYFYLKAHSRKTSLRRDLNKRLFLIYGTKYGANALVKLASNIQQHYSKHGGSESSFKKTLLIIQKSLSLTTIDEAQKSFIALFEYSESMEENRVIVILTCSLLDRFLLDLVVRSYEMRGTPLAVAKEIAEKHLSFSSMQEAFNRNTNIKLSKAIQDTGYKNFYHNWKALLDARNEFLHRVVYSDTIENRELAFKLAYESFDVFGKVWNSHLVKK